MPRISRFIGQQPVCSKRDSIPVYRMHNRRLEYQTSCRLRSTRHTRSHDIESGKVSDYKGAALLLGSLPKSHVLLADRGYDTNWFRQSLISRGITPCIPSKRNRKVPVPHDREFYKQRHKVEIMCGRLKDWRRIAMRYDRCAHTFFSAICIACCGIFYLNE